MHIIGIHGDANPFGPGGDNWTIFDIQTWRLAVQAINVELSSTASSHVSSKTGRLMYTFVVTGYLDGEAGDTHAPIPEDIAKPDSDVDLTKTEITVVLESGNRKFVFDAIVDGMEIGNNEDGGNANPVMLQGHSVGHMRFTE